jgi:hypothetical protein
MQETIVPAFAAWESYYVIVGSSAAALARRTTDYRPVLEDWIWHIILPDRA